MTELDDLDAVRTALRDRYEVVGTLGRGSFSTVLLAHDLRADRKVAIKVLHAAQSPATAGRFQREIRRLGALLHPNIVTLLDAGEVVDHPFLVSAYTEGETLRARLRRSPQQPLDVVVRVASQVADALAYMHRYGVVHRDLKPENVFLATNDHVLVLDFGLAKALLSTTEPEPSLTAEGGAIGTLHYMSPEQIGGEREIDGRTDLYALGCVMYEMLAGERPFHSASSQAVVRMHLTQAPRELTVFRPEVPEAMKAIVRRLLAKAPADRYQDAQALYRDLVDLPLKARGTAWSEPRRLSWRLVAGGAAVAIAALAYWAATGPNSDSFTGTAISRVAILPFEDDTQDRRYAWLARALTREVSDALAGIAELSVLSPESIPNESLGLATIDSIGRLLRARIVMSGSLDLLENRLRATIRVRDVDALKPVRAPLQGFAHPDSIQVLRTTLVDSLIAVLRSSLGRHLTESRWRDYAPDPRTWQLVLHAAALRDSARALGARGGASAGRNAFANADGLLVQAERANARWVEPIVERGHLALARAAFELALASNVCRDVCAAWLRDGRRHAERALQVNGRSPRALTVRASSRLLLWEYVLTDSGEAAATLDSAAADLDSALAIGGEQARTWLLVSNLRRVRGDFPGAAEAITHAIAADPWLRDVQAASAYQFFALLRESRWQDANRVCAQGARLLPTDGTFRECRLTILGWSGSGAAAIDSASRELLRVEQRLQPEAPDETWTHRRTMLAAVLARSGMHDSARAVVDAVSRDARGSHPNFAFQRAYVHLLLGDTSAALRDLRRFLDARPQQRSLVREFVWFRGLRGVPAFDALVAPAR